MYHIILEQNLKTFPCKDERHAQALLEGVPCNARIEREGQTVAEKSVATDFNSNLIAAHYLQGIIDQGTLDDLEYTGLPEGFYNRFMQMQLYISKCIHEQRILIISGPSSRELIRTLFMFNIRKTDNYYPPLPAKFRAYEHAVILKRYQQEDYACLSKMGISWHQQHHLAIYDLAENDDNYVFDDQLDTEDWHNITWQLISERLNENINTVTILGMEDTPFHLWQITGDDEIVMKLMDNCEIFYPDQDQDHTDMAGFSPAVPVSADYSFKDYVN